MEPYEDKETAEVKSETEKHPIKYVVNWQNYGDNVIGYLFPIDEEPFTTIGIEEEQNSDCSSIKIQTEPNQELNEIEQNDNLPDTQERPFHCDECPKNFKHKTSLNRHKRIHSGEMRYQCDECFKKFNHDYRLAQHKLIHTGEMDFVCDECDMKFRQRCHLTRHTRIHTGETPYHCDQCYMKFVQQSSLIIHKRVHTGELPYECDECPMKFSMKSNLNSHKKLHAKSVI